MDMSPIQHFNISTVQNGITEIGKKHIALFYKDMEIVLVRCRSRKHGPFHSHSNTEIVVVLEGTLMVHLIDRSEKFSAGEVIVIPPDLIHATSSLNHAVKMMIRKPLVSKKHISSTL